VFLQKTSLFVLSGFTCTSLCWSGNHCHFAGAFVGLAISVILQEPLLVWQGNQCHFAGAFVGLAISVILQEPLLVWQGNQCHFAGELKLHEF